MAEQNTIVGPEERDIRTVVADPPWGCERGGGESTRGAQRHYPLLDRREIVHVIQTECPAWRRVADSAHLYLWTTNNALARGDAHFVARRLGFTPKTFLTWSKTNADGDSQIGLGFYFRHCTEQILFATRGETIETGAEHSTLIDAPRGAHSSKPESAYEVVEDSSPPGYLELFARETRDGWTSWGNELQD